MSEQEMYVIKRYFDWYGNPCDTVLSELLPKAECEKRLEMFQRQYQSTQYVMELWEDSKVKGFRS